MKKLLIWMIVLLMIPIAFAALSPMDKEWSWTEVYSDTFPYDGNLNTSWTEFGTSNDWQVDSGTLDNPGTGGGSSYSLARLIQLSFDCTTVCNISVTVQVDTAWDVCMWGVIGEEAFAANFYWPSISGASPVGNYILHSQNPTGNSDIRESGGQIVGGVLPANDGSVHKHTLLINETYFSFITDDIWVKNQSYGNTTEINETTWFVVASRDDGTTCHIDNLMISTGVIVTDTTAPTFSDAWNSSPSFQNSNTTFNITITDADSNVDNIAFFWNNTGDWTTPWNLTGIDASSIYFNRSFNITANANTEIAWLMQGCDDQGNCDNSSEFNITVNDNIVPVLSGLNTNATNKTKTGEIVNLSATCNDETGAGQIWWSLYNQTAYENGTSVNYVNNVIYTFNLTISEKRDIDVNLTVYCNDSFGNEAAFAGWIGFTVNNTAPVLTIISPADADSNRINLTTVASCTDADSDAMSMTLRVNGSISNVINGSIDDNIATTLVTTDMNTDNDYSWNITCDDSLDIITSANRVYTLDTTLPVDILLSPLNGTNWSKSIGTMLLDYNCRDDNILLANVIIYNGSGATTNIILSFQNDTTDSSDSTIMNITETIDISDWSDGTIYFNTSCSDSHTNTKPRIRNFTKDIATMKLDYNSDKGNTIGIKLKESDLTLCDFGSELSEDGSEYIFWFDFTCNAGNGSHTYTFKTSDTKNELMYLPDSSYKGHFVTKENYITYHLDSNAEYSIKETQPNKYETEIITDEKFLLFKYSIGGLNIVETQYQITMDSSPPSLSNFNFFALNSSKGLIGIDETAFNFSNLQEIEFMKFNFTLIDASGINGDIELYYTANGTKACALGNNQSSTCFSSTSFIHLINGSNTSTFIDVGVSARGDSINCTYVQVSATQRNYNCEIDEHYNPNVWKHYPLDFTDIKWQNGTNERIKQDTVWEVTLDSDIIPLDADLYKLDFRINYSLTAPTEPVLAYLCNSSYITGNPATSDTCILVASRIPEDLQDDGTKFRSLFTDNLTSLLGDIKYVLITSDSIGDEYYVMKTYRNQGEASIVNISNDNGISYTKLSDGYETELNINWFYNGTNSNITKFIVKIYSNDTMGKEGNSSEQIMEWTPIGINNPPVVDIITPEIDTLNIGNIQINWTTSEPNGDRFTTNLTLFNGTHTLIDVVDDAVFNYTFDGSTVNDGIYNLTVESCENTTADLLCGNDTHQITIDNFAPTISGEHNQTLDNTTITSSKDVQLNATIKDGNLEIVWLSHNASGSWENITVTTSTNNIFNFTISNGQLSSNEIVGWLYYANDTTKNIGTGTLQEFLVQNIPPTTPILGIPVNESVIRTITPFFNWTNATDIDDDTLTHRIVIDDNPSFTSADVNVTANNQTYTQTLVDNTNYFWYVYANDGIDINLSETRELIINRTIEREDGLINITFIENITFNEKNSTLINISIPKYSTIKGGILDLTGIFNISDGSELCPDQGNSFAGLSYNGSSFFIMWKGTSTHSVFNIQSYDLTSCSSIDSWNISWSSISKPDIGDMFDFNGTDMWILNQSGGSLHKTDFPSNPITPIKTHIIKDIDCFQWVDDVLWTTNSTHLRQHSKSDLTNIDKSFSIDITTACLDMTWDGNRFWITDWNSGGSGDRIYALDIDNTTMVYNKTGSTVYYITYNNTDIIYSDGSNKIYNFDGKGGFPTNITVKTNNITIYENLTELNRVGMSNINLNNNSALQTCVNTCSDQEGIYCICSINVSSGTLGTVDYTINISYYPYSWSFANGSLQELTTQQYGLIVPRIPNSTELTNTKAALEFDGEIYTATVTADSEKFTFNVSLTPRIDETAKTLDHHWIFNRSYSNETLELFTMNNQSQDFFQLSIGNCNKTAFNISILNVTFNDEGDLTNLSSDLDVSFENFILNGDTFALSKSFNFTGITNVSFCFNVNYTARFDAVFVYTSSGYTQRIYNFLETLTPETTFLLDLFLSNDANLTNIFITLFDENSERLNDYFVKADRFYPDLSEYRNIETVRSDVNGELLFHLIPLLREYRLRIFNFAGDLVKVVPKTTIKSSTVTITVPTQAGYLRDFDDAVGASSSLNFDNDTKEVLWQSTTTVYPQSCLSVVRITSGGKSLYNNCQTGASIVDTYTITENTTGESYQFLGYFTKTSGEVISGKFKEHTEVSTYTRYGTLGILLTIMITVTLFMLGIFNPAAAIFLGSVGFLLSAYIGFIPLAMSTAVMIIIMTGYLIYKTRD